MIFVVAEDDLVVVAALEDVVRLVRQDESGLAGHGVILTQPPRSVPD
jgi:hypothetical protein